MHWPQPELRAGWENRRLAQLPGLLSVVPTPLLGQLWMAYNWFQQPSAALKTAVQT